MIIYLWRLPQSSVCVYAWILQCWKCDQGACNCSEWQFDGLVQERRNSLANALESRLSCTNPSIYTATTACSPLPTSTAFRINKANSFLLKPGVITLSRVVLTLQNLRAIHGPDCPVSWEVVRTKLLHQVVTEGRICVLYCVIIFKSQVRIIRHYYGLEKKQCYTWLPRFAVFL